MAASDGIKTIVATPHYKPGRFVSASEKIHEKKAELVAALKREDVEVVILLGADVAVIPELNVLLNREKHLMINGNRRYFLAELPHDTVPPGWDRFLLSLLSQGKVPILTHPERNPWFVLHPEALYAFVVQGGMVQITAMSLTGGCGEKPREFALLLLKHNLVHAIATDAHDTSERPPVLSAAVQAAADVIGAEKARALVTTLPQAIIEGRPRCTLGRGAARSDTKRRHGSKSWFFPDLIWIAAAYKRMPITTDKKTYLDKIIERGIAFLLIFTPLAFGTVQPWAVSIMEIATGVVFIAWLLVLKTRKEQKVEKTPLLYFMGGLMLLVVLQILPLPPVIIGVFSPSTAAVYEQFNPVRTGAWRTLSICPDATKEELFKLTAYFMLFIVIINHYRTREQIQPVIRVIVGMGVFLVVFAVVQKLTWNGSFYWIYPSGMPSNLESIYGGRM